MRVRACLVAIAMLAGFAMLGCPEGGPAEEGPGGVPAGPPGEVIKAKDAAAEQGVTAMWPEQQFSATGPIKKNIHSDYQGKRVYFATQGEKEAFDQNPNKDAELRMLQQMVGLGGK
jgi:hypothetical protein